MTRFSNCDQFLTLKWASTDSGVVPDLVVAAAEKAKVAEVGDGAEIVTRFCM